MISTYPTSKRIILCIDNDESILRYEKALLERSGYVVLTAASAQQALRLVTMCKCDAVLLDYDMPVINGYDIALEIKRTTPDLIVIMVSGSEVPMQALALADAFVPKLDANRQLLPMIADLCARTHDPRQKNADLTSETGDSPPRPSPRGSFEYGQCSFQPLEEREEDS
jgi:two-component system response regulator AtoC